MNSPDYVSLATAAVVAAVPASTLRQWIDSGKLPASAGEHGRLVRLEDVWRLTADAADTGIEPHANGAPRATDTAIEPHANGALNATDEEAAPAAVHPASPQRVLRVRRRQRVIGGSAAVLLAKLDELYRAQIAAKDGEIAAKDDLIAELRLRAQRAEQQTEALEHRLMEVQTPVVAMDLTPIAPTPPRLLARLFPWLRHD